MLEINCKMYEPADILVYVTNRGLVLKEKSLVAYDRTSGKIVAFGTEAERLAVNPPENIQVCSPFRQGRVSDFTAAVQLFTGLMHRAFGRKPLRKPAVAVCVPKGLSEVEKRALEDLTYQAGAREILIADFPLEEFVKAMPEKQPKLFRKYKMIFGITKDDPESYIKERLSDTLSYAAQTGVSAERVLELLKQVD